MPPHENSPDPLHGPGLLFFLGNIHSALFTVTTYANKTTIPLAVGSPKSKSQLSAEHTEICAYAHDGDDDQPAGEHVLAHRADTIELQAMMRLHLRAAVIRDIP